jgi:hypothetical protein
LYSSLLFFGTRTAVPDSRMAAPPTKRYKRILDNLMSSVHRLEDGQVYPYEHEYTAAELREVTPAEMIRWMNLKTFGVPERARNADTVRPMVRANTLAFWKNAISFSMPDRLHGWRSGTNDGNPTKSAEVNDFIKSIKRMETRRQGAVSQTQRPMQESEFRRLHKIFKTVGGRSLSGRSLVWKYGMPALMNFQFHLIARIDDTTQVILEHIRTHDTFENALKTRLNLSKNVQDERNAPWQIVLGSMDPVFCVLISLGVWLELNLRHNPAAVASPYVFAFTEDITIPSGGQKAKDMAQTIFGQRIFRRQEFQELGLLGSHSIRKFASTHVRKCGILKDDKDTRGRWKGKGRVSDWYDDVELPYPDCRVAEKLCLGGPCFYLINTSICSATVLSTFILTKVVPNIRKRLPDSTSIVLGMAVLWLVFSSVANNFLSEDFIDEVKRSLNDTGVAILTNGQNPILKMPVLVSGSEGTVYIDELAGDAEIPIPGDAGGRAVAGGDDQGEEAGAAGGDDDEERRQQPQQVQANMRILDNNRFGGSGDQLRNWFLQLQSGMMTLRRELIDLRNETKTDVAGVKQGMERGFEIVNGNMRRYAMQASVARRVRTSEGMEMLATAAVGRGGELATATGRAAIGPALAMTNPPTLMPHPKSLYDLWNEYLNGVGGRKPARLFSATERGRIKYKYTRRKVVWDLVRNLVNLGHTAERAIDMIYDAYGAQTNVSNIINRIRKDKMNGTLNPNLVG